MKAIVVALGGNALIQQHQIGKYEEQLRNVERACKPIAALAKKGYAIAITHGNGPQVGNLEIEMLHAKRLVPPMPLHVAVAMTQAEIGFMIQQSLQSMLPGKKIATIVTQVEVDPRDSAFQRPTKPIGPHYTAQQAAHLERTGEKFAPVDGKGYRKVVASPKPKKIIELKSIQSLLKEGTIVVCCGGGGIPVARKGKALVGVEAVIDKDRASALLAKEIKSEKLLIATDVEFACTNFGTREQKPIRKIKAKELRALILQGAFGEGSMKPKLDACAEFVQKTGKKAIITSLNKIVEGINEKAGTVVVP